MNSLLAANIACLEQGVALLGRINAELYSQKCPDVFGSTIGGHFRHNLDHYRAFVKGVGSGRVNYDARDRSLDVEVNPETARACSLELAERLRAMAGTEEDRGLAICMDDGGSSVWTQTSFARELQFLLSHTIHHYALVVAIATRYGIEDFPEGFGVAPSTLHYRETMTT